jgi:thymidine kinase
MAKLLFSYGGMNASKSAVLKMQAFNHEQNGKKVLIYKPKLDNRNDGVFSRAIPTYTPVNLVVAPEDEGIMFLMAFKQRPRTVLIDEAQFLTPAQIEELALIVDTLDITVHAYGLMTDFRTELFAGSKRLVELADNVERIRSECTQCNNEGIANARFINGQPTLTGEQIVTGAEETYKVLCRKCFNELCQTVN